MAVKLIMLRGRERVREIPLRSTEMIIGRGSGCDLRITSPEISRNHCRIQLKGNEITIRDLGSSNGTVVNGQAITGEALLRHGDMLELGSVTLLVETSLGNEPIPATPLDPARVSGQAIVTDGIVLLNPDTRSTVHQVKAWSGNQPAPQQPRPKAVTPSPPAPMKPPTPPAPPPPNPPAQKPAAPPADSLPFADLAEADESNIPFADLDEK